MGILSEKTLTCIIEVNSETDFVSKNNDFQEFIDNLLEIGVKNKYSLEEFLAAEYKNIGLYKTPYKIL